MTARIRPREATSAEIAAWDRLTVQARGGHVYQSMAWGEQRSRLDEAQAAIGAARATCAPGSELDELLMLLERDLWVLMAELATDPDNRHKLTAGQNLTTAEMVERLEVRIDALSERFEMPTEFVVPGENPVSAALDVARTVVRRAERDTIAADVEGSEAVAYLNRLSDLLWTLARWQEGESRLTRDIDQGAGA
jgi:cob(I)alamin adenosyltransferase